MVSLAGSFPANVICAIGCALLSYMLIKRPAIAMGRSFAASIRRPAKLSLAKSGVATQRA